MKFFLQVVIASFLTGLVIAFISIPLELEKPFSYWFLFGACLCFFTIGFAYGFDAFETWRVEQPKFKGVRYWIKKTFEEKQK